MILSAYSINKDGILVYSGLPTQEDGLLFEHHNGLVWSKWVTADRQYEIWAIGKWGFIHGISSPEDKYKFVLIGNCLRYLG